jgi:hypothetical protein
VAEPDPSPPPAGEQTPPAPAPDEPATPAPAPTSGGGNALGNAVNQTLVGLGQSVGQATDALLGPQSLVGGTLGALGGALAGASAGG